MNRFFKKDAPLNRLNRTKVIAHDLLNETDGIS